MIRRAPMCPEPVGKAPTRFDEHPCALSLSKGSASMSLARITMECEASVTEGEQVSMDEGSRLNRPLASDADHRGAAPAAEFFPHDPFTGNDTFFCCRGHGYRLMTKRPLSNFNRVVA